MSGYIVYWPQEQIRKLKKEKDTGPVRVVLGSIHSRMPSITSVKVGDVVYPVTVEKGILYVMARLPVEKVESAFDYLVRETGDRHAALIPPDVAYEEVWSSKHVFLCSNGEKYDSIKELPAKITRIEFVANRTPIPHLCHQEPFNCCSKTAASGSGGSAICPRPIPEEKIPTLLFGSSKEKQMPLKMNANGQLTSLSLQTTRKMSEETKEYFDSIFDL